MSRFVIVLLSIATVVSTLTALYYKHQLHQSTGTAQLSEAAMVQLQQIQKHITEIRIATYPNGCDAMAQKVMGERCDVGNYMEWAGPNVENEVETLLNTLKKRP